MLWPAAGLGAAAPCPADLGRTGRSGRRGRVFDGSAQEPFVSAVYVFIGVATGACQAVHPQRPAPVGRLAAGGCAALVPLLAAVSYILPLFVVKIGPWANDIGPGWLKKLDDLLTCRISLAWAAYRVFDIKIAGQFLQEWPALDNIFVYLLYLTGPVMVVLVCALMMAALYGYARRGAWQTVACLVTMLAYGYMESQAHPPDQRPRRAAAVRCGVRTAEG